MLKLSGLENESTVARVSLSLPPRLLQRFDQILTESGFKDRSKALQATMRSFITEEEQVLYKKGPITGALLMVYNHETRGIDSRLTDLEHDNREIIASSTDRKSTRLNSSHER